MSKLNKGEMKCYGCGRAISFLDAYMVRWHYYCEGCTDSLCVDALVLEVMCGSKEANSVYV